jgi:hypothetical protein
MPQSKQIEENNLQEAKLSLIENNGITVREIIHLCYNWKMEREAFTEMTTWQVVDQIILPITRANNLTYCDYIRSINLQAVGEAQVFVSHAWRSNFTEMVDALSSYFKDDLDTYVWIDIFSVNQHNSGHGTAFLSWTEYFQRKIRSIGKTVLVIGDNWKDPEVLRRSWCIYELFCTYQVKADFDIAMNQRGEKKLIEEINENPGCLKEIIGTVDYRKAQTSNNCDKILIDQVLNETNCSERFNQFIVGKLLNWITERCDRVCRDCHWRDPQQPNASGGNKNFVDINPKALEICGSVRDEPLLNDLFLSYHKQVKKGRMQRLVPTLDLTSSSVSSLRCSRLHHGMTTR